MTNEHHESCLCGAVRFTVEGAFERFFCCHCHRCQKDTGAAHVANLFSSSARLRWLAGADRVTTYVVPGARHTHAFCSTCGSPMPYQRGPLVVVPAGSLDSAFDGAPDAHIFVADQAPWESRLAAAPRCDGLPP